MLFIVITTLSLGGDIYDMSVVSISMPDSLLAELDTFIEEHGYSGRSEAVREGTRSLLNEFNNQDFDGQQAVCVITTMFDHDSEAETRLSELRHTNEDLVTSNVHSHACDACLELFVAEGVIDDISVVCFSPPCRRRRYDCRTLNPYRRQLNTGIIDYFHKYYSPFFHLDVFDYRSVVAGCPSDYVTVVTTTIAAVICSLIASAFELFDE